MPKKVPKVEQETVINFNEQEDEATVLTFNKRWQRQIENKMNIEPDEVNVDGSRGYTIPKKSLRLPLLRATRQLTEEEKQVVAKRFAEARAAKAAEAEEAKPKQKAKAKPKVVPAVEEEEDFSDLEDLELEEELNLPEEEPDLEEEEELVKAKPTKGKQSKKEKSKKKKKKKKK